MGEGVEEGEGWERKKTHHVIVDSRGIDGGCQWRGWWRLVAGWVCVRERERECVCVEKRGGCKK